MKDGKMGKVSMKLSIESSVVGGEKRQNQKISWNCEWGELSLTVYNFTVILFTSFQLWNSSKSSRSPPTTFDFSICRLWRRHYHPTRIFRGHNNATRKALQVWQIVRKIIIKKKSFLHLPEKSTLVCRRVISDWNVIILHIKAMK